MLLVKINLLSGLTTEFSALFNSDSPCFVVLIIHRRPRKFWLNLRTDFTHNNCHHKFLYSVTVQITLPASIVAWHYLFLEILQKDF